MRYVAIDFGLKRTGLAVGDDQTGVVSPLDVVVAQKPVWRMEQVVDRIKRAEPDAVVVGLPLNMDGSRGEAAKQAEGFAEQIGQATGLPVHLMDERLSSVAADQQLAQTGLTHQQKKVRRDALAAAAILRDFLNLDHGS